MARLKEGQGHAEKLFLENIWWPAFGHFEHLHPEYEVYDFRDGNRYLDFAYIRPYFRVAIEIDGFGPHWRNIGRWQFSDHLHRQNHLVIDGWRVIRFSYDDVNEKPRVCQQSIQQLLGRWYGDAQRMDPVTVMEKEIVRLALRLSRPITPRDVCDHLMIAHAYARKLLHDLVEKNWLKPASGHVRVRSYSIALEGANVFL